MTEVLSADGWNMFLRASHECKRHLSWAVASAWSPSGAVRCLS